MSTHAHVGSDQQPLETGSDTSTSRRLDAAVQTAMAHVDRLESEHAVLLADGDAIQEDRDASRSLLEHARHDLELARDAVRRIAEGTYGECTTCGRPIGEERLAALPGVETCVLCRSNR
jgi:DnaK suppressor protein